MLVIDFDPALRNTAHMVSERTVHGTKALGRAVALLDAILLDDGAHPGPAIAAELGLASSTARRLLNLLVERGMIARVARGRYVAGDRLRLLAARASPHASLIERARSVLRRLARQLGGTAHLGIFDNDMVTYLVKEGRGSVFTREQGQLEAYCTGIGKALLAQLPDKAVEDYLALPLVGLTAQTITDPVQLRGTLADVRARGFAVDDREMREDLCCVAVPLGEGFAISVSGDPARFGGDKAPAIARMLTARARAIAA